MDQMFPSMNPFPKHKMKPPVLLLLYLSVCLSLQASPTTIEERLDVLQKTPDSTTKVDNYVDLAKAQLQEPERAIAYAEEGIKLAQKIGYADGEADLYGLLGNLHWSQQQFENARSHYQRALSLRSNTQHPISASNDCSNIGLANLVLGEFADSLSFFERGKAIRTKQNRPDLVADSNQNIGTAHYYLGDYQQALTSFIEAATYYDSAEYSEKASACYNNIGAIYMEIADYERAESYFRRSYEIDLKSNDLSGVASSLGNLGNIQIFKENYEQAIELYEQSLAVESNPSKGFLADSYNSMGNAHMHLKHFKKAKDAFLNSLQLKDQLGNEASKVITLLSLSELFDEQTLFNESLQYATQALDIARESESKQHLDKVHFQRYRAYKSLGDIERALEEHEHYQTTRDALMDAEKHQQITELESKYQLSKKTREIESLEANNKIKELRLSEQAVRIKAQRWLLIIGSGALGMFGFGLMFYLKWNQTYQENKRNQLLIQNLRAEQKVFRAQMNPHFIYNTLNSIQSYISSNESYQAETYLSQFAKLMRGILENSMHEWIPLEKEIAVLRSYMELEQLRFDHRFRFEIHLDEALEEEFLMIPPMLIQPFIENAILHGLSGINSEGVIILTFKEDTSQLQITIDDNGIGRRKAAEISQTSKKKSLATEITRQRLEVISAQSGTTATLEILDKEDPVTKTAQGTRITLKIPIVESNE